MTLAPTSSYCYPSDGVRAQRCMAHVRSLTSTVRCSVTSGSIYPGADRAGLDDPTFVGRRDPWPVALLSSATRSFRSTATTGSRPRRWPRFIGWAKGTGEVGAVLAAVAAETAFGSVLSAVRRVHRDRCCRVRHGDLEVVYRRDIAAGGVAQPASPFRRCEPPPTYGGSRFRDTFGADRRSRRRQRARRAHTEILGSAIVHLALSNREPYRTETPGTSDIMPAIPDAPEPANTATFPDSLDG